MEEELMKENINTKITMGEISFLYEKIIIDDAIFSRTVYATIVNLNEKGYFELLKDNEGKILININKKDIQQLRYSEQLIYMCVKELDVINGKMILSKTSYGNNGDNPFLRNKKKIIDALKKELIEDGYIKKGCLKVKEVFFLLCVLTFVGSLLSIVFPAMIFLLPFLALINFIIYKSINQYTKKGKMERKRILNMKKYLKEYSLIKDKQMTDVYVWEKYLAFSIIFHINNNIPIILSSLSETDSEGNNGMLFLYVKEAFNLYEEKIYYIDKENKKQNIK